MGHLLATTSLWLLAQLALAAVVWPAAGPRLGVRTLAGRAAAAHALASFAVLTGTTAFLLMGAPGGRLVLALLPFAFALALRQLAAKPRPTATPTGPAELRFVAALTAAAAAFCLCAAFLPPFQYDSLLYHLPGAALAWQQQTLFVTSAHPQIGANPFTAELPKLWAFAFSGDDSLSAATQIPYLLGLACFAFAFARRLRAPAWLASTAALFTALTPKAFDLASSPNVDLIAGFWGAASAWALFLASPLAAAAALVVFAQLKYTTLLPATIGALLLSRRVRRRRGWPVTLAWLAFFTAVGGFWEWRNLAVFGNPTHPYQILAPEGLVSLAKPLAPRWFVAPGQEEPGKWPGYFLNKVENVTNKEESGPLHYLLAWADLAKVPYDLPGGRWGPAWILFGVPGLFLALLRVSRALRSRRKPAPACLPLALAFLFCLLTPKSWETRFSFLLLPFAYGAAAALFSRVRRPWIPRAGCLLLLAATLYQLTQLHSVRVFLAGAQAPASAAAGLPFTSRDPARFKVAELAAAVDRLEPKTIWIDFTHGEKHEYGMSETLLYPYFSRSWNRKVTILSAQASWEESAKALSSEHPEVVIALAGSRLHMDLIRAGYRPVATNEAGGAYASLDAYAK